MNTTILLHALKASLIFLKKIFRISYHYFVSFKLKKNDFFYQGGEIPKYSPFIVKGCMMKFFMNKEEEEKITHFYEEPRPLEY
jgi:hypothetical protein